MSVKNPLKSFILASLLLGTTHPSSDFLTSCLLCSIDPLLSQFLEGCMDFMAIICKMASVHNDGGVSFSSKVVYYNTYKTSPRYIGRGSVR